MGQKSLTWIRLSMICYIVPWWQSWLSNQVAFRIQNLMLFEEFQDCHNVAILGIGTEDFATLNLHFTSMPPIMFRLNLTYCFGGDVV